MARRIRESAIKLATPAATVSIATPVNDAAERMSGGPSAEMRRFSAGMRAIVAILCTLLLFSGARPPSAVAAAVLLAYGLWSAHVLWIEATGRRYDHSVLYYWVDIGWAAVTLQLTAGATNMLVLTLVQPVVVASIGYGVRRGLELALFAALGVLIDFSNPLVQSLDNTLSRALPAVGVLALVPAAALLSRPLSVLRQRLALVSEIEASLDPRRGLQVVAALLVDQLRIGTSAQVVGLVLPSASGGPATLCNAAEGAFRASDQVHLQLEALLADTPGVAVTHVRRRRWRPASGTRVLGGVAPAALCERMETLAELLEVRTLVVVPLSRYQRRHGHLLLGLAGAGNRSQDVMALAQAAPELLRIVELAALVDQLQETSAGQERARIGRDLHDSAIQPYLGLKYAVECLALRIPHDNPARGEVDALAELVNGEVAMLRELISGMRSGSNPGDSALVPAVRRQARRFALLFGIDVEVDCPESLATTRALADSLFHMVNEALNNIRKHSGARRVWITMSVQASLFRLAVRDDGGSQLGRPAPPFEPASLSERAHELGGTLHVSQPDGLNVELVVQIPLS